MIDKETERYERNEMARLDAMYDDIYDDRDCEYDIAKQKYEDEFAVALQNLCAALVGNKKT